MASQDNNLGTAGFVISLVGILSCGFLSPVGAILSLMALNKEPKGLAIAGLVIGILGSAWVVVALIFGLFAVFAAAIGIGAKAALLLL
jgi:hypothetical protein